MANILGKFADPIYGLTRLVLSFNYACHGAQKLFACSDHNRIAKD